CLDHLDDRQLLDSMRSTLAQGRKLTAQLIAHLSEVESRRLHLHAACPSMFDYCVSRLGLSEDEACRRIDVARLARRFPEVYPLLADGSLSLSVVAMLKPHLGDDCSGELLRASRGLSVLKVRELLAARFPRPDVPSTVRKLPESSRAPVLQGESAQVPLVPHIAPPRVVEVPALAPTPNVANAMPPGPVPRAIEPLAAERYRVQLTASSELKRKLEQCRDLMRHGNPTGDFAPIVERALDLLLEKLMRERFGAAQRSRASKTSSGRRPDRATRRAVVARDGLRCSWIGDDGERCVATGWLELDHAEPFAKGGGSGLGNVRVLCRAHNRLSAELEFGAEHVERAVSVRRGGGDPR
ncbi:MAG: HNH endonuclease, partial [Polyangiaceae bacterium]